MKLYRPVLIESAEQAEALPVGTLAVNWEIPSAAVRIGPDEADGYPWLVNSQNLGWHSHIVGHTALVPIEAEEERVQRIQYDRRGYERLVYSETRLVTPWEEA